MIWRRNLSRGLAVLSSIAEVPNHRDRSRYRDLKKVQAGPEKLPNWYISLNFDATGTKIVYIQDAGT